MNLLLLCPGRLVDAPSEIKCFTDVWAYYLVESLRNQSEVTVKILQIPSLEEKELDIWFDQLEVAGYDAVIALGLRYFSTIPREIGEKLRQKLYPNGFLCQIHDGSRLDNDPVDITFTPKDESEKYPPGSEANRYVRHYAYNQSVGWAADPGLNSPNQDPSTLTILVDHTNYGQNTIDKTVEILEEIKKLKDSGAWHHDYKSISVRRFDSGQVVDVDLSDIKVPKKYDRRGIPFTEICKEHSKAHVFCVTHPESVGLVVLETAMAGALVLSPQGFVPKDRLNTVKHIEWTDKIDWAKVLSQINPVESRKIALKNSWGAVARRIQDTITIYQRIRRGQ